jgi:hypothetical protein
MALWLPVCSRAQAFNLSYCILRAIADTTPFLHTENRNGQTAICGHLVLDLGALEEHSRVFHLFQVTATHNRLKWRDSLHGIFTRISFYLRHRAIQWGLNAQRVSL